MVEYVKIVENRKILEDVSPPKVAIKSLLLSCLKDVAKILRSGYSQNN